MIMPLLVFTCLSFEYGTLTVVNMNIAKKKENKRENEKEKEKALPSLATKRLVAKAFHFAIFYSCTLT